MTSPFDDVKKGERYSGETSFLGLIFCWLVFCVMYFVFCVGHLLVFLVLWTCDVCIVDMCLYFYILYEHVLSFIYGMSYFWHGLVYDCLLFIYA